MNWEEFTGTWNSDVKASFLLCKAALRLPLSRGAMTILTSSGAAIGQANVFLVCGKGVDAMPWVECVREPSQREKTINMISGDTPDEPMLLDRAKRGDPDAFQRLAEPYRRELLSHCYRMMGSLQEAEDLVQETFLRLWRGLDGFEERNSFRNWLHRIATNACLNALAGRQRASPGLPEAISQP